MTPEEYMRAALASFVEDPPDDDYQRGYLEGLKVFANEAMGFKWDDPLLWRETPPIEPTKAPRPQFTVIDGGRDIS